MSFNEVLKILRDGIDISQKHLSNKINIDIATYKNYENGNLEPDFKTLINISNFFKVSTDYLLGVTDLKNDKCYYKQSAIDETALTEDENQLLKSYRKLSAIMKAELRGEIKGILRASKEEQLVIKKVKHAVVKRAM